VHRDAAHTLYTKENILDTFSHRPGFCKFGQVLKTIFSRPACKRSRQGYRGLEAV
jgi:hypothetical protein